MALTDILLVAFGATISLIGTLILFHLRSLNRRMDRYEDANQKAHDLLTAARKQQGEVAECRAQEDREANECRAQEDREVNRAAQARLFDAVSGLQGEVSDLKADVKVLRDRSDRSDRSEGFGEPAG